MTVSNHIYRHKKGSVYTIFLLSYISILLLTLSSNIIYYAQISRQVNARTEFSRQLLLTQLQTTVESGASEIERLGNEVAFDNTIYQYSKGVSAITPSEIKEVLASKMYRGNVLYDYFIYVRSNDEIITPTIRIPAEKFYNIIYTFEHLSYEDFRKNYLDSSHFQKYMPLERIMLYDSGSTQQVLPYIQTYPIGAKEPLGAVICLLDAQKLFSDMELIRQSTGSDVYVLDSSQQVIISSQDAAPLISVSSDILTNGGKTQDTLFSTRKSDSTGWKFVLRTPASLSWKESRKILAPTLAVFMIYLLAGLVLVHFLTGKSYRPISELNRLIKANTPSLTPWEPDTPNEFDLIRGAIIQQSGIINSQLPIVRRAMFDRVLKGLVIDYTHVYERFKELGTVFPTDQFLLVNLELEEQSPFFKESGPYEENLCLARLIASNVGGELFENRFFQHYIDFEQQQCVFLLCSLSVQSKEAASRSAMGIAAELLQFIRNQFYLNCYIGVSKVHSGLSEIPLCFDESRKASEYGRLMQVEAPVVFDSLQDLDNNYYYPAEMEYQLISSLKSGQFDQARTLIDTIFQLNTRDKSLSSQALKGLLFELNTTLLKQMNSIHIARGEAPVPDDIYESLLASPSIKAAKAHYFEMIEQISQQKLKERGSSKTERLAASIAGYIQEHAEEEWVDLNTLSEEFHVTPQYISNIFKRCRCENIKDYISKVKLEKAKELLLTTDLSVNDIARKLGYAGEIGIIRLFKKYEDMTPGDFRNLK